MLQPPEISMGYLVGTLHPTPSCLQSDTFWAQVGQLGQLFGGLKEDVEALLLQAPSVSLDELAAQLHSTATMLQEQVCRLGLAPKV